ncbi:MAG: GNAT family N-acetyltransferase [archaeon]|jgi:GNAT superfamily N-acetyltransferase
MQITIIPKKDLKLADDLQQQILNPTHKRRYRTFGCIHKNYNKEPSLFIGAYDKGKLIGIAFGFIKKSKILLGEMAILENYRNKGIGQKLLSFFEKQAKKLNKKYIELGAWGSAEKFYLKNNYKPLIFVQIYHQDVPKNYKQLEFEIIKETNYADSKRLWIKKKYNPKLKEILKKKFNAYNVIYLFRKEF